MREEDEINFGVTQLLSPEYSNMLKALVKSDTNALYRQADKLLLLNRKLTSSENLSLMTMKILIYVRKNEEKD